VFQYLMNEFIRRHLLPSIKV